MTKHIHLSATLKRANCVILVKPCTRKDWFEMQNRLTPEHEDPNEIGLWVIDTKKLNDIDQQLGSIIFDLTHRDQEIRKYFADHDLSFGNALFLMSLGYTVHHEGRRYRMDPITHRIVPNVLHLTSSEMLASDWRLETDHAEVERLDRQMNKERKAYHIGQEVV